MTPLAAVAMATHAAIAAVAAGLSHRTRALRPIAYALVAQLVIAVARAIVAPALVSAQIPYIGIDRVVFAADVVAFALVPGIAAGAAAHIIAGRPWWPAVAICGAYALALVSCYPTLHGSAMVAAQGLSRPLALAFVVDAVASTPCLSARIRAHRAALPALLVGAEIAASIGGAWLTPWTADLAWDAARVVSIAADGVLVAALVWAGRYRDRE